MDGLLASVVDRSAAAVDDGAAGARSCMASSRRSQMDLHENPIGLPEQPGRLRRVGPALARIAVDARHNKASSGHTKKFDREAAIREIAGLRAPCRLFAGLDHVRKDAFNWQNRIIGISE